MKKLIVVLSAIVLALIVAAFYNRSTWEHYRDQQRKREASDARKRAAEEERARLLEEKAELESPRGKEQQARGHGYVKEGERPLDLRN